LQSERSPALSDSGIELLADNITECRASMLDPRRLPSWSETAKVR
jgi:hypothetical protein